MDHLVEGRGDEAGEADDVGAFFAGGGQDFFARDHDAEVDDLVVVTGEHDADDVLADVVHVALDRGHDDFALGFGDAAGRDEGGFFGLHVGLEVGDGFFHYAGAFDDLGEEHLARAEEVADDAHAVHERAFDDGERFAVFLAGFLGVGVDPSVDAFDEGVGEALLDRAGAPGFEDGDVGFLVGDGAGGF